MAVTLSNNEKQALNELFSSLQENRNLTKTIKTFYSKTIQSISFNFKDKRNDADKNKSVTPYNHP